MLPISHRFAADVDPALVDRASTFRNHSEHLPFISTAKLITAGEKLKWRKGDT